MRESALLQCPCTHAPRSSRIHRPSPHPHVSATPPSPPQVCRRGGKELLEFIERLAGTASLKTETEEVQTDLDDRREEALGLEGEVQAALLSRKQLQPQASDRPGVEMKA